MASLINKARKPKFELHLKIYDLNNVPLVSGVSLIKWHLPHSIHTEHRGRTAKCPIANHRVEYGYSRVVPLRIGIDRSDRLVECPIEFEVLQEFSTGAVREEKITLGRVALNLSEYVEESEAILREVPLGLGRRGSLGAVSTSDTTSKSHSRKRSSASGLSAGTGRKSLDGLTGGGVSPTSSHLTGDDRLAAALDAVEVEEGVVRRYLMQDSKINSTLKIGILMIQVDGEHNFVAPALKTAPVFGGLAGIVSNDREQAASELGPDELPSVDGGGSGGHELPTVLANKSRDASELQDMYRRALAASWACQPGELPADECIEDIFAGGDGWKGNASTGGGGAGASGSVPKTPTRTGPPGQGVGGAGGRSASGYAPRDDSGSASGDEAETYGMAAALPPRDLRPVRHHFRHRSGSSDKSSGTVTAGAGWGSGGRLNMDRGLFSTPPRPGSRGEDRADAATSAMAAVARSRSESLASLATTMESERARGGFKRAKEVNEFEMRDDFVAWRLPGRVS